MNLLQKLKYTGTLRAPTLDFNMNFEMGFLSMIQSSLFSTPGRPDELMAATNTSFPTLKTVRTSFSTLTSLRNSFSSSINILIRNKYIGKVSYIFQGFPEVLLLPALSQ